MFEEAEPGLAEVPETAAPLIAAQRRPPYTAAPAAPAPDRRASGKG